MAIVLGLTMCVALPLRGPYPWATQSLGLGTGRVWRGGAIEVYIPGKSWPGKKGPKHPEQVEQLKREQ